MGHDLVPVDVSERGKLRVSRPMMLASVVDSTCGLELPTDFSLVVLLLLPKFVLLSLLPETEIFAAVSTLHLGSFQIDFALFLVPVYHSHGGVERECWLKNRSKVLVIDLRAFAGDLRVACDVLAPQVLASAEACALLTRIALLESFLWSSLWIGESLGWGADKVQRVLRH